MTGCFDNVYTAAKYVYGILKGSSVVYLCVKQVQILRYYEL